MRQWQQKPQWPLTDRVPVNDGRYSEAAREGAPRGECQEDQRATDIGAQETTLLQIDKCQVVLQKLKGRPVVVNQLL